MHPHGLSSQKAMSKAFVLPISLGHTMKKAGPVPKKSTGPTSHKDLMKTPQGQTNMSSSVSARRGSSECGLPPLQMC